MIKEKLLNIDRRILYGLLILVTVIPLRCDQKLNNITDDYSNAFYEAVSNIPEGKTVFIESDWTTSTRGENSGHLEALLRILMAKKTKFAIFSVGDAQAPGVFRGVLLRLMEERKTLGLQPYQPFEDYVDLGYFANAEGTLQAIGGDVRKVFEKKSIRDAEGKQRSAFDSPVLSNVKSVGDVPMYIVVTASNTIDRAIERLSAKTTLACMCTGVIGPSALPYFQSGQLKGVAIGLKGVFDIEYLMANGLNLETKESVKWSKQPDKTAQPITVGKTLDRGNRYFLSFMCAILLLIATVVTGNVMMFVARAQSKPQGDEA